jgi:hypothetical protein
LISLRFSHSPDDGQQGLKHAGFGGISEDFIVNLMQLCAVVSLEYCYITYCSCLYFSFNRALQMITNTY